MAHSRKAFIEQLLKLGFSKFTPKGDIHKYVQKEYFKLHPIAVGISPRNSTIDIAVYQLEHKATRHFDRYPEATLFLKKLNVDVNLMINTTKTKPAKVKRANKKGSLSRAF